MVTTDGTTLLGSDDKSGIAEIMTAVEYLVAHPEIKHGEIRVGFGPDEEIGVGADKFDVDDFNVDFAYTVDGGPLGEIQYETFSAAALEVDFMGRNVHPGTAKNQMINALQLAIDFHNQLPKNERPENTEGYEGFFHLHGTEGTVEKAHSSYIIRDFEDDSFENRKKLVQEIADKMNAELGKESVIVNLHDQYYNMKKIIEKDLTPVELAKEVMEDLEIKPVIDQFVAEQMVQKSHLWEFLHQIYLQVVKICMAALNLSVFKQWKKLWMLLSALSKNNLKLYISIVC